MADRPRATPLAPASPALAEPVTGVASGNLGTAANLEDTQLWLLEDLREPEPPLDAAHLRDPSPRHEVDPMRAPDPLPALHPRPAAERLPAPAALEPQRVDARGSQRRTGAVAAAVIGILALAALLAARDGLPGGATRGSGDAAGAFPSLPPSSIAPATTSAPDAGGSGGGGGGNGRGGGNGNGGGNGHGGGGGNH